MEKIEASGTKKFLDRFVRWEEQEHREWLEKHLADPHQKPTFFEAYLAGKGDMSKSGSFVEKALTYDCLLGPSGHREGDQLALESLRWQFFVQGLTGANFDPEQLGFEIPWESRQEWMAKKKIVE